ncbi:MAG TPA: glycosyltransferase family 87 protein [Gaiellaceae bacterium]|nr:glycosyltransferase family 87 protein [Gaiellaceae bacterium]
MWVAFRRIAPFVLFGALPVAVMVVAGVLAEHRGSLGNDFRLEFYPEAKLVLHGTNPFPAGDGGGPTAIFPVPAAVLVAPLTLLPVGAAVMVDAAVLVILLAVTLWALGVKDWRLYGLLLLWGPALAAVETGNVTIPLALLVALAWRYRDRTYAPGLLLGAAIAIKLFLWPLLIWLLATRRFRAAGAGAVLGIAGGFLLVLPFTSLTAYLHLLDELTTVFAAQSYTVSGALLQAHVASLQTALLAGDAVGLAVLALAYARRSLPLALGSALLLSPIVWTHYFVLLAIPLAIRRPALSAAWFIPLVMWFTPGTSADVRLRDQLVGLAVLAAVTALAEWLPHEERRAAHLRLSAGQTSPLRTDRALPSPGR